MKLTQQATGRFPVNASWIGGTGRSEGNARRKVRRCKLFTAMVAAVLLGAGWLPQAVRAQTPTVLGNFGFYATGANPVAGVITGPDGNLYGVAPRGGAVGAGAIFKYDFAAHSFNLFASFSKAVGSVDIPVGQVAFDNSGNIVGVGNFSGLPTGGAFAFHPIQNAFQTLSANIIADVGVVRDSAGNIYGIDTANAPSGGAYHGVFKINSTLTSVTSYAPLQQADIDAKPSALVVDNAGNLYGTTQTGGVTGQGSIVKVDATTHAVTTVYSFKDDSFAPMTALTIDAHGNLFGTTSEHNGPGGNFVLATVFEWSPGSQMFTTIHSFDPPTEGNVLGGPLTIDADGNLFGTTLANSQGTVFEINGQSHELTTLASFTGQNGSTPTGQLVLRDGMLYGTTEYGGVNNQGVIYAVALPEPASSALVIPFVALLKRRRRAA